MVKFCFECGAKNNGGRFCSECGTRFDGAGSSANGTNDAAAAAAVTAVANSAAANAVATQVGNAAFAAAKRSYQHQPLAAGVPMAVPVGGGAAVPPPPPPPPPRPSAFAANNSSASLRSSFNAANGNSNGYAAAKQQQPEEVVPPAATGADAQEVYESCVSTIRAARGGGNEAGVKTFKQNCKLFGLKQMDVKTFYDSLVAELGAADTRTFVPHLARLIPDDLLRKDLIEYNARQCVPSAFSANSQSASYRRCVPVDQRVSDPMEMLTL